MSALEGLSARFVCEGGCSFSAPLTEVVYRCPECGGLLEVKHEIAPLRKNLADKWKALFGARWQAAELPGASGVWGKREWVLPEIRDEEIVSLGEGRTPVLPLPRLAKELSLGELLVKQCGVSPTGSFKDLGMTVLVSAVRRMRAAGTPIRAVACASTGDTSAALAAYCARAQIPAIVFLPKNRVSLAQLIQPLSNGALVLALDCDFDRCMQIVQRITEDKSVYLANSMNSLRLEGQKTVAVELAQQLGWEVPDWVVIPGGNLGNVSALGNGFELLSALGLVERRPRIAVAQSARANPLVRSFRAGFADRATLAAGTTLASAIQIGAPVSFARAVRTLKRFDGVVEEATETELAHAAARADREGAFCCPQTGVALASLAKLALGGVIAAGSRVVVISTAHGLKFPEFKRGYHSGSLESVESFALANPPVEVPADEGAVRKAIERHLDLGLRVR